MGILQDAYGALVFYSTYDVATANEQIKQFTENMQWDSPFIMQLAGLPFSQLEQCSFRIKKGIIEEVKKLIDDTLKLSADERRREEY